MTAKTGLQTRARAKHLLSYLAIGLLPILICGMLINYAAYTRRTEQQDEAVQDGFQLFGKTYAALLSSMDSCAGHLEDNLDSFLEKQNQLPGQLALYQKNYNMFQNVFFYRKGSSHIYTTQERMPYAQFEAQFAQETGVDLTRSRFFVSINEAVMNDAVRSRTSMSGHADGEYIFYLRTVPALDANPKAVVIFCVSTQRLLELLQECVPADYAYYAYSDPYLSWLYSSAGAGKSAMQEALNRIGSAGMAHAEVGAREYLLLREKSERDDMNHMLVYDCETLYAPHRMDMLRSSGGMLLLLLPVAIAAFILHRRNYTPIATLLDLPLPKEEGVLEKASVETLLDDFGQRARRMLDENEKLHGQAEDQRAMLRAQTVLALINGGDGDAADGLWAMEPAFAYPCYTMLYSVTALLPEMIFLPGGMAEISRPECDLYILPMRENCRVAVLVNHMETEREEIAKIALEEFARLGIRPMQTGMGLAQRQKARLHVSLAQAQAILTACASPDSVAMYTADEGGFGGVLSFADKMLLRQCIRNGSKELALSTLHKMHSDILALSLDKSLMRSWCFFLYDGVAEALREHHLEEMLMSLPPEETLYMPLTEFVSRMEAIIAEACDSVGRQDEKLLAIRQESLVQYVDTHFRDVEISLSSLGEKFALSESYITRFFKQQVGMSFLQYVSSLRMQWVKAQLAENDRPIKEIVNEAGYADIANFTRKFRTAEGVTPGQYRAKMRGEI